MKLNLFLVLCLSGLVTVVISILRTVPHKYDLIKTLATWPVAQNYCRTTDTDLAIILSDTDWVRLNYEAKNKSLTTSAWVGLYNDVNSWRWSLHDLPLINVTYTYWSGGEPNNYAGIESCVMACAYGLWCDVPCTWLKPFICYNASFTDASKFIGVSTTSMTWLDARQYCRTYHTDLASSFNSSDSNYLWTIRDRQGDSWIGLYRDTWKWSDGTNATNLQWAPGQPDNYYGNQNCAFLNGKLFSDDPCTNQQYFFCHTLSPSRVQIMKVQVMSDESVLDPEVQSFILNQIMQQLKKYDMLKDTTVKWRVQRDGKIFHKKLMND